MLQSLEVQNYALINRLKIDFFPGLSIITGETGAGKSILLGAMGLITGERADTSVLYDTERKCIVEAVFDISAYPLQSFFLENDLDYEPQLIVRREIRDNGKSRAFVNDTPVNVGMLKAIGSRLIDIHSQHENLNLADHVFQLRVLDHFARAGELKNRYDREYDAYKQLNEAFEQLKMKNEQAKTDFDYYQFQYNQLEEAKLQEGEQESLEEELEKLNHAEDIKLNLSYSHQLLNGEENSVVQNLNQVHQWLQKLIPYYPIIEEYHNRINSAYIDLKDLSNEIEGMAEDIVFDPSRIAQINDRLNTIYELQQKHHVSTIQELQELREHFKAKIEEVESFDQKLESMLGELEHQKQKVMELGNALSEKRMENAPPLEEKVLHFLHQLGMPHARFNVNMEKKEAFGPRGFDDISFLFTANKHGQPMELSRVASGGEISRLMLSLKSILSEHAALPTIIFDEIDAGVSGEIADKMGNIIKDLSARMQVINITHLPQIAGKGQIHYKVYKTENHQATLTEIKQLSKEERVMEIAKMLSGEALTEAAVTNARELLSE